MIGLSGSHRVGKTSLAKAYAEKFDIAFVQTSVSAIFSDMGLDPAVTYDFATRLAVQEEILKRLDRIYAGFAGCDVITDRTPLDFLSYTLGDAVGDAVPPELQDRLAQYVQDCFDCLNRRFALVVMLQPGLPLVHEEGKAAINGAYIEHLNSLVIGLANDERNKVPRFFVPRRYTSMEDRVAALGFSVQRTVKRVLEEAEQAIHH